VTSAVHELGKWLVFLGLIIVGLGALLWSGFGRGWLGQLPGDIRISRGDFSLYIPIVTCLIVSVVLTILLWLFRRW
jgi:hypothetical protein